MPKIDLTITISVVIAVCAIISPILTALINNNHLYKMKKIDMKLENQKTSYFYKRGIYEDYLKAVSKCIIYAQIEDLHKYGEIYPLAIVYFPDNLQSELISLNELICQHLWEDARKSFYDLTPKIRAILQSK